MATATTTTASLLCSLTLLITILSQFPTNVAGDDSPAGTCAYPCIPPPTQPSSPTTTTFPSYSPPPPPPPPPYSNYYPPAGGSSSNYYPPPIGYLPYYPPPTGSNYPANTLPPPSARDPIMPYFPFYFRSSAPILKASSSVLPLLHFTLPCLLLLLRS